MEHRPVGSLRREGFFFPQRCSMSSVIWRESRRPQRGERSRLIKSPPGLLPLKAHPTGGDLGGDPKLSDGVEERGLAKGPATTQPLKKMGGRKKRRRTGRQQVMNVSDQQVSSNRWILYACFESGKHVDLRFQHVAGLFVKACTSRPD